MNRLFWKRRVHSRNGTPDGQRVAASRPQKRPRSAQPRQKYAYDDAACATISRSIVKYAHENGGGAARPRQRMSDA